MFSSLVQAGMRAITPRHKRKEEEPEAKPGHQKRPTTLEASPLPPPRPFNRGTKANHGAASMTTPLAKASSSSQASVPTPSTVATVDITANTTLETIDSESLPRESTESNDAKDDNSNNNSNSNFSSDKNSSSKTNNENTTSTTGTAPLPPARLWKVLDTQLRVNTGASVRCGICLSTVADPVRTPCGHGFCRSCLQGYLRSTGAQTCPTCKAPCTRRSLEDFGELADMADAYKGLLRAFGLAPGTYCPEITTMTQKVDLQFGGDDDDEEDEIEDSHESRFDRLCVAATYQALALPNLQPPSSSLQVRENEQVVQANFAACYDPDRGGNPTRADALLAKASNEEPQLPCSLPNTQDVQEQAREQLEADREMEESMEQDQQDGEEDDSEDEDDDGFFVLKRKTSPANSGLTAKPLAQSETDPPATTAAAATAATASEPLWEGPPPSPPSPPIFARADTGTKNLRHTKKSFSKRDKHQSSSGMTDDDKHEEEPFASEALSPIDHEASYWTVDATGGEEPAGSESSSSSRLSITGLLEDSRGALHMMDRHHRNRSGNDGRDEEDASIEGSHDDNDDDSEDKTIAMTMDDSPEASFIEGHGGRESNHNSSHHGSSQVSEASSSSSDEHHDSANSVPLTYDPVGNPTHITDEFHASTKHEIGAAANLPAGPPGKNSGRPSKKALFPEEAPETEEAPSENTSTTDDDDEKERKPPALGRGGKPEKEEREPSAAADSSSVDYPVGTIVDVQARTWPGVNKQGGVGRITGRNPDGTYNVAYVLGGKESGVDAVFVSKHEDMDNDQASETPGGHNPRAKRQRKARENHEDDWVSGLPEELLEELAREGFHIPGRKKKPKAKRKGPALAEITNGECRSSERSKARRTTNVAPTRARGSKRKLPTAPTDTEAESSTTIPKRAANAARGKRKNPPQHEETSSSAASRRKKTPEDLPKTIQKSSKASSKTVGKRRKVTFSSETNPETSSASGTKPPRPPTRPTEITHEEAIRIAENRYQERIQKAISNQSVVVVASNLSDADKAILRSLCAKTLEGGLVLKSTETVDQNTTLCVVPSKGGGSNPKDKDQNLSTASVRTLKVMLSALGGIPLVTPDWLRSCYLEKKLVQPQRFLRTMPTKEASVAASGDARNGIPRIAAAHETRAEGVRLPFGNTAVYLCGKFGSDQKRNLQTLLEAGGAAILSNPRELNAKLANTISPVDEGCIVIVCGGSSPKFSLAKSVQRSLETTLRDSGASTPKVMVVDFQWVIESVTCAKPLSPRGFEPAVLKSLWKLCLTNTD